MIANISKPIKVKIGSGESRMILMPGKYGVKNLNEKLVTVYHLSLPDIEFVAEISDCELEK